MAELAQAQRPGRPVQVRDIAQRQRIPEEYLGQIMVLLKRANLVHGTRGPGGGYLLARPPERISVAEVLRALEGPPIAAALKAQKGRSQASPLVKRLLESLERAVNASEKILEEITLRDLSRPDERSHMYYI